MGEPLTFKEQRVHGDHYDYLEVTLVTPLRVHLIEQPKKREPVSES